MVNAPQMWRERRKAEIEAIQQSIRNGLKEGRKVDEDKIILGIMGNLGISRMRAKEYLEVALFNEGIDLPPREEENGKL